MSVSSTQNQNTVAVGLVSCPAEKTNFPKNPPWSIPVLGLQHGPGIGLGFTKRRNRKRNRIRIDFPSGELHFGISTQVLAHLVQHGWGGSRQVNGGEGREQLHTFAKQLEPCRASANLQHLE